jgi:hypothetical protein
LPLFIGKVGTTGSFIHLFKECKGGKDMKTKSIIAAIFSLIIFNQCDSMEEWYKPENHFSGKELQVA